MSRRQPMAKPWGHGQVPAHCEGCGVVWLAPPEALGLPCLACGRALLLPSSASLPDGDPELSAAQQISREQAASLLALWVSETPFPVEALKSAAIAERLRLIHWPRWLVDTTVRGEWTAEVGLPYEASSTQESFVQGRGWTSREVRETRLRWEPRRGTVERRYDNVPVPALLDDAERVARLGPASAGPIEDEIEGLIWLPDRHPHEAWSDALPAVRRRTEADLSRALQTQHIREVRVDATETEEHWTWSLRPAWVTTFEQDGTRELVVVDAVTGEIAGRRPASWPKAWARSSLWLLAAGTVFTLLALLTLTALLFPPLVAVGVLALLVPLAIAAIGAAAPLRVWSWNRAQTNASLARSPRS